MFESEIDWKTVSLPGLDRNTLAVVVGGGGAIGGAAVIALEALGVTVVAGRRIPDKSSSNKGAFASGNILACDVCSQDSVRSLAAQVMDLHERAPDLVINCTGVGESRGRIEEVTVEQAETILKTNVLGSFWIAQAFGPAMCRSERGGSIVFISSIVGDRVRPGAMLYGVSKTAVKRLTQQFAVDFGPSGVRVNSISPGQTPTPLRNWFEAPGSASNVESGRRYDVSPIPLRRRGTLSDYVGAILFLGSSLSSYVTGADIKIDGGSSIVLATSY
ncbi:MAG: SDR family oxidoreductase [Acidimicrobiaceae bacterium]|nr:SDR family oxidoreductase [Acidimicrobiaceae bacterium]